VAHWITCEQAEKLLQFRLFLEPEGSNFSAAEEESDVRRGQSLTKQRMTQMFLVLKKYSII